MRSIALAFAALAGVTTPALAQRAPDLATLDRGDGITKLGLDLGYTVLDDPPYSGALRLEPYGQYVSRSGFGIYGTIPFARSFGGADGPPDPQDAFALGNLELGLLYVVEPNPTISLVFRGGLVAPIGSDSRDGALTNLSAMWPRFTDLALVIPDAWYGRLSFSPLIHVNRLFVRADLGLDIGSDDLSLADELLRLNVGAGYDFGVVALGLELVNLYSLDEFDLGDNIEHTVAATFRFMGEALQPFLSVGTPVDEGLRDGVHVFFAAGIQAVFH
jgi:hypothetical protein